MLRTKMENLIEGEDSEDDDSHLARKRKKIEIIIDLKEKMLENIF